MEKLPFKTLVKQKFAHLSAGQKKVAAYLIRNLEEAAFKTAFQIGKEAKVSETTVIRLSYALGFDSFSEMQSNIQDHLLKQNKTDKVPGTGKQQANATNDPFAKVIENEIHILRQMLNPTNIEDIWKTVDSLIQADQVLIAGYRISHAAAYWFSYILSSLRGNVSLCSTAGDFYEKFSNLTSKSVVVVFSFPRYAPETLKIAECAKEHKVRLISITDRLLSPVGQLAYITLATEENAQTGTNSIASVISLLELIIEGILEKDHKRAQVHQQKLEKLYSNYEVFVE
ncbi:MurR/RpiR family transcriptional regulator [Bacillus sp. T33-2]|uniref:MurR/RpiR family transcriptional regulator n=1 Tax=Bacillus sp. T33-2 TaxID=2054168 RepID=UPI000C75E2CE|nr:MurR/RpiR family transcriptional regulator [Bacillus sp. T33-2]PLR95074.1 MurR/RpiR family transcriptional regulator [Bacillus sp. T33-2]